MDFTTDLIADFVDTEILLTDTTDTTDILTTTDTLGDNNLPQTFYENLADYFPFDDMRGGQLDVINQLQDALTDPNVRNVIVEAPTGWGKSAFALTAARASKSAYIATANKFLQDQYADDFSHLLQNLKGRSNYACEQYKVPENLRQKYGAKYNCANSPCRAKKNLSDKCAREKACQYHKELIKAANADITSFNFAALLPFINYVTQYFQKRNLLVFDECHKIVDWVTDFVSISFDTALLKEVKYHTNTIPDMPIESYASFITDIENKVNSLIESDFVENKQKLEAYKLKFLIFNQLTENKTNLYNFVLEKEYSQNPNSIKELVKISFKPVVLGKILEKYLYQHAEKCLFLSATILDIDTYMHLMGLEHHETKVIQVPSIFDKKKRPIFTNYAVGRLNRNNLDEMIPYLTAKIEQILSFYPNVKGIIHGTTYRICEGIYQLSSMKDRIIYPTSAALQNRAINTHVNTKAPTILLSPSLIEGLNLKDDLSRLQIIVKTPFPYRGDPVLKQRIEIYPGYYEMLTALNLVQSYGRSIRSTEDFCYTFVLDDYITDFIFRNKHILPRWFIEAVQGIPA